MSLEDFWTNVRIGARFLAPSVTADSPRINSAEIERVLQRATIWLTPKSVKGFDSGDFKFLSQIEQDALAQAVARFLAVAREVPADKQAKDEQVQKALPEFQKIIEIMAPNRFSDPEAFEIGKRIEQRIDSGLPASVLELRFETGQDSSGGEGLWIWVVFKDEVAQNNTVLLSNVETVRRLLQETVRELGIERWPYVRFRTESDLDVLETQEIAK